MPLNKERGVETMSDDKSNSFPGAQSEQELLNALGNDVHAKGINVSFRDVRRDGDVIKGVVNIHWEEKVAGKRIVLIDADIPFSVKDRQRIFEKEIDIAFGIKVKVYAEVFYNPPNQVCVEVRATWPGGSVGAQPICHTF